MGGESPAHLTNIHIHYAIPRRTNIRTIWGMRKRRERITKGFAAVDDRTVWTLELNRDELMIILNGIKNHRIKGARMKLAALREQRNRRRDPGKAINVKSKKK